ncbi:molybdopterin cofactor-binding domain-containing protein [Primorskyibacter sp. S187A]|uniref:xanthine dehydrogenase family protein molybdopterin-binding subunit n=1 Tax=Primorskyibacter sp. S187A TaxID=3415130 RepID=UPI003C7AB3D3
MASIGKIARRTFLFGAVAITGGVAFGVYQIRKTPPNPLKPAEGESALNPFVMIDQEGVTLVAPRAEMGQGTRTTLAALIAEELDVAWEDIRVIHGPAAKAYYNSAMIGEGLPGKGYDASKLQHAVGDVLGDIGKLFDLQVTGGSTAMKDGFERMRVAGATAREMMKAVAAERLGVSVAVLRTENGSVVAPDGTALPYTELASEAAAIDPPRITLRDPSDWKYLGRSMPRVDMVEKVTGTAEFGVDVRLPGMKFTSVRRNPHLGGSAKILDTRAAEEIAGVDRVVDLGDGYAVVANNTWIAMQALDAVEVEWGPSPLPASVAEMADVVRAGFETEPNSTMRDDGDASRTPSGATVIEAEYMVPHLAHATMEPQTATALIDADGLHIWAPNQAPTFTRDRCAELAGLSSDQVEVETTYLGGGFGRRGEMDFSLIATKVAMAMPGTPVQVTWSREEDMTHDFYRPMAMARFKGAVSDGKAVTLNGRISSAALVKQAIGRATGMEPGGPDKVLVEGAFNQPYAIPNFRIAGHHAALDVPVGFWRAVGNSYNGFFMESFMDEMAHAAGRDPLEFRMELARDEHRPSWEVLNAVREMSGWTGQTPEGVGRGVAMTYSFGTPVAQVLEVREEDGLIRLSKAWIACDMGVALDPSIIEAQMFGGMIYGLSAAMTEEITLTNGAVDQLNFPDYDALRMHNTPAFEVRILETNDHMGGAGEPGTPPAPAALANALFDLTGERVRELPLNKRFDFV